MQVAELSPPVRRAEPADGRALAELVNFAGEGLPFYLWTRLAGADEDPWEVGAQRQSKRAADGCVWVIDEGSGVVAAMMGHPIDADPAAAPDNVPAMLHPLMELEAEAPGTWYVNVLAAYPRARGRGHGARLVRLAETMASDGGLSGVSVIVADANTGARRLYERLGFEETARRPMVKETWESPATDWILMIKPLVAR